MNKGLSDKSRELRRHLLSHNGPDVVRRMQESGFDDPVGLIVEMTDDTGNWLQHLNPARILFLRCDIDPCELSVRRSICS